MKDTLVDSILIWKGQWFESALPNKLCIRGITRESVSRLFVWNSFNLVNLVEALVLISPKSSVNLLLDILFIVIDELRLHVASSKEGP